MVNYNDEVRINAMNDIIQGIARRSAHKFYTKDAEELAQELWVHIMEKEAILGHSLDLNLIAKICYDKIVDMQRYDMKRNAISLDVLLNTLSQSPTAPKGMDDVMISGFDFDSKIMIEDLFKMFPEGSKEHLFLEFWGEATGTKGTKNIQATGQVHNGFTESCLAQLLGYPGTSSGGYKAFRRDMRRLIAAYFGKEY